MLTNLWLWTKAAPYLRDETSAPTCKMAMVLGARVYQDGTPCSTLRDRLLCAARLYKTGKIERVLVSGAQDEVGAMATFMRGQGVADLDLDPRGVRTFQSCVRVPKDEPMLVVTNRFHLRRSVYLLRSLGVEAFGVEARAAVVPAWRTRLHNRVREHIAQKRAVWDIILHQSRRRR